MKAKDFINKELDANRLVHDIKRGVLKGVHFHDKGVFDGNCEVIELVVGRGNQYTYSFKIYVNGGVIHRIERVRFEWECGGWRSHDHILKRFPIHLQCEGIAGEILGGYLGKGDDGCN